MDHNIDKPTAAKLTLINIQLICQRANKKHWGQSMEACHKNLGVV